MKKVLLVVLILSLTGCATGGRFFKGFSEGYSNSLANAQARNISCTTYTNGNYASTSCR